MMSSGVRADSLRCHDSVCDTYQYCSELVKTCASCADLCDKSSHTVSLIDCQAHCQDYLHDITYQRLDGNNPQNVASVLTGRVSALIAVVAVLSLLTLVQLVWTVYTVLTSRRRRNRIRVRQLMLSDAGTNNDNLGKTNSTLQRTLNKIGLAGSQQQSDLQMQKVSTIATDAGSSSIMGPTPLRPNSLQLGHCAPSEDSCPTNETEAIYENLAFSATTPVVQTSMLNRPLPQPTQQLHSIAAVTPQSPQSAGSQSQSSTITTSGAMHTGTTDHPPSNRSLRPERSTFTEHSTSTSSPRSQRSSPVTEGPTATPEHHIHHTSTTFASNRSIEI